MTLMERLSWVDTLKCIGIWLMVLGHSNLNNPVISILICAFHMPVFFFVSGMFFKNRSFKEHLSKDVKSLIQPYFLCSIISLSICWISPYLHPELYHNINSFTDIFIHAIYGILTMDDRVTDYSFLPYGPLWFLPALFIARLYFLIIFKISRKKESVFLLINCLGVVLSILLFFICRNIHLFSVDSALLSVPFLVMGYYFKKYEWDTHIQNHRYLYVLICGILFYNCSLKNESVNIDAGIYGLNLLLFYLNAMLGIILTIAIIHVFKLDKISDLSLWGANSLIILAFHLYLIIPAKIILTLLGFDVSNLNVIVSFSISLITMYICKYIINIVLNYCPVIIGKNK